MTPPKDTSTSPKTTVVAASVTKAIMMKAAGERASLNSSTSNSLTEQADPLVNETNEQADSLTNEQADLLTNEQADSLVNETNEQADPLTNEQADLLIEQADHAHLTRPTTSPSRANRVSSKKVGK